MPAAICVSIPVSSYIYVTVTGPAPVHNIGFGYKAALVYVNVLVKVLITFSVPGFAVRFTVFVPDPVPGNFPVPVTELYYCLCFLTCTFFLCNNSCCACSKSSSSVYSCSCYWSGSCYCSALLIWFWLKFLYFLLFLICLDTGSHGCIWTVSGSTFMCGLPNKCLKLKAYIISKLKHSFNWWCAIVH